MNPNSDLKNNESVMAANAESRISAYAARFAAYSDERLKQTVDHERKAGEDGIEDNDWSLNAGRYVGVVIEDDGMTEEEFRQEMLSLNDEFSQLSTEAGQLEKEIGKNIVELFGEE